MPLTDTQRAGADRLPQQIIEYELVQIDWYREEIERYEAIAHRYPLLADEIAPGIRQYRSYILQSQATIEQAMRGNC